MGEETANIADIERVEWDAVIVGTGMGGATLGYALAKSGKKVLFCEKGKSLLTSGLGLCGDFAESFFHRPEVPQAKHRAILMQAAAAENRQHRAVRGNPHWQGFRWVRPRGERGSDRRRG